jgi:hypothetical protein
MDRSIGGVGVTTRAHFCWLVRWGRYPPLNFPTGWGPSLRVGLGFSDFLDIEAFEAVLAIEGFEEPTEASDASSAIFGLESEAEGSHPRYGSWRSGSKTPKGLPWLATASWNSVASQMWPGGFGFAGWS